eukprot:TRINITY_DN12152_c0_g1_i2.p1 TRINITY_DN12152_c0_g1~~TRINITY_DN12152_c0_g1_i2.p1  ORF type:complete len:267 (+),score=33.67 TRINITY_DN12152_c0_g1_i2:38-802(+)
MWPVWPPALPQYTYGGPHGVSVQPPEHRSSQPRSLAKVTPLRPPPIQPPKPVSVKSPLIVDAVIPPPSYAEVTRARPPPPSYSEVLAPVFPDSEAPAKKQRTDTLAVIDLPLWATHSLCDVKPKNQPKPATQLPTRTCCACQSLKKAALVFLRHVENGLWLCLAQSGQARAESCFSNWTLAICKENISFEVDVHQLEVQTVTEREFQELLATAYRSRAARQSPEKTGSLPGGWSVVVLQTNETPGKNKDNPIEI